MDRMTRRDWLRACAAAVAASAGGVRAACEPWPRAGDGRLLLVFLDDHARPQGPRLEELRQRLAAHGLGDDRLRFEVLALSAADQVAVRCAVAAAGAARPLAYCVASAPLARATLAHAGDVPVVFTVHEDPVAAGLVDALGTRRANATGFTFATPLAPELKGFELMAETFPRARRVLVLADDAWSRHAPRAAQLQRVRAALGLEVLVAARTRDPAAEVARAAAAGPIAAYLPGGDLMLRGAPELLALLQSQRVPHLCGDERALRQGAMLAYAPRRLVHWDAVAAMLRALAAGTPAREIPVQWPAEHLLSVSLAAWHRMGLVPAPRLLRRAHTVV
jgi:ABC-type uncharacterized transport system substrate-binding protein